MNISKKTKKAGIYSAVTCIILVIIIVSLIFTGFISVSAKNYPEEHLFVDATYLLKTNETNSSVDVACNLYLTNIWDKESGDITATAYVIESDKNFAVYKKTVEVGTINPDSTGEIQIPIVLSNNSYKVEILIFEDGKLVIKGQLTISSYPVYDYKEIVHEEGQIEKVQFVDHWDMRNSYVKFNQIRDTN